VADENTGGSRLILQEEEPVVKTVRIPLPPQLKADEQQQREAENAAEAVGQAALLQQARKGATRPAPQTPAKTIAETIAPTPKPKVAAAPQNCPSCGSVIAPESAGFSFCTHCGADLPKAGLSLESDPVAENKPPVRFTQSTVTEEWSQSVNGVRDPRATVRKIAQVHAGVGQAQLQQTMTTMTAVQGETREVNSTVHAILSFLFPGVGQLLNGQVGKGMLLILAAFVAVSLMRLPAFGLELLIVRVLIALDAYRIGEKRRNGQKVGEGDWDIA
jgi:DNA-directed RNA polymerase subunit M/transcription elongation factor TFIIS